MSNNDPAFSMGIPDDGVKPYGSNPRGSNSDASREVREEQDEKGVTGKRQREILSILQSAGPMGMTWREIQAKTKLQQGQITGPLSELHKAEVITRLALSRRAKCSVYVMPEFVENRATVSQGRKKGLASEGSRPPVLLSRDEADLIAKVREAAILDRDKPMPMRRSTVRTLLGIIDRAL